MLTTARGDRFPVSANPVTTSSVPVGESVVVATPSPRTTTPSGSWAGPDAPSVAHSPSRTSTGAAPGVAARYADGARAAVRTASENAARPGRSSVP